MQKIPGEKHTILIVDDTQENILLLSEILESDYLTKAAMNGERALKIAFSAEPPDLVLLDVKMPGILKILMRSGTLYSVKAVNVSKAMADIYMQPPIDKYELLDLGPAHEIEKVGHQYAREVMSKQLHDNELLKSALLI